MKQIFKIIILIFAVVCISSFSEYYKMAKFYDGMLHLYYLNVGEGDSFMIKTPENQLIMIDGGPGRQNIHRISSFLPFWIDKIDLIIVSHSHIDHITGVIEAIRKYKVGCLIYKDIDPPNTPTESYLRELIKEKHINKVSLNESASCISSKVTINNYRPGIYIDGKSERKVLPDAVLKDQNMESIISWIKYGSFDALFTADATIDSQSSFLKVLNDYADLKFEVMKAAHQGSRLSLNKDLLYRIQPDIAVVSVGPNTYGHPHQQTLDFYRSINTHIYRTDEPQNYIDVSSDGKSFEVSEY